MTQQQLDDESAEAKKKRGGPKRRKVTHGKELNLLYIISLKPTSFFFFFNVFDDRSHEKGRFLKQLFSCTGKVGLLKEDWSRSGRKVVLMDEGVNRAHPMSFGLASFRGHIRTITLLSAPGDQEQTVLSIDSTKEKTPLVKEQQNQFNRPRISNSGPQLPVYYSMFLCRTWTLTHFFFLLLSLPLCYSMCLLSAISYDLRRW